MYVTLLFFLGKAVLYKHNGNAYGRYVYNPISHFYMQGYT